MNCSYKRWHFWKPAPSETGVSRWVGCKPEVPVVDSDRPESLPSPCKMGVRDLFSRSAGYITASAQYRSRIIHHAAKNGTFHPSHVSGRLKSRQVGKELGMRLVSLDTVRIAVRTHIRTNIITCPNSWFLILSGCRLPFDLLALPSELVKNRYPVGASGWGFWPLLEFPRHFRRQ